jgi:acetoin utilization deacetylase AcuC-like enzyme
MSTLRRIGRRLRHLMPRGRRTLPHFLYHPDYRRGLTGVPMDAMRGERILTWLLDEGWLASNRVVEPRPATLENLLRVHPASYLRTLEDRAEVGRVMGLPLTGEEAAAVVAVQRLAAGGTIQASRLALRSGGVAFHLGGGFHHAGPSRGTGFCVLNDVAVAVARLRARGFEEPVLVVDLDLHDGNGTRAAFADDATVHTFSMHNEHWEEPRAVADTSIAFGPGIQDGPYLELLRRELPPVFASFRPGFVFYVAGVDPAADDGYGDGRLTRAGLLERDRVVTDLCRGDARPRPRPIPMAVVLAGGYGASAWRASARFAAWLLTGLVEEPPDDVRVALDRARRSWGAEPGVRAGSGPGADGSKAEDPFDWSMDASDLQALGVGTPAAPLLLGRWPVHRLRDDLERFGILAQLRNRGYPDPLVELRGATGLGPVVRVWSDRERTHLLVELRVELDRTSVPGHALLRVEWLLLQDPRAGFTEVRPPLPGQSHPGLGALADVVAWLVTLCREMELDGILFRTAHWHLAALARRHLRFLSREDAERFDAVARSVHGRSLAAAAAQLERDRSTGNAAAWNDMTLVIPVGPALAGRTFQAGETVRAPDDRLRP